MTFVVRWRELEDGAGTGDQDTDLVTIPGRK